MIGNMSLSRRHLAVFLCSTAMLTACSTSIITPPKQVANLESAFVVLGEGGVPVARVVTTAVVCPEIHIDSQVLAMQMRAPAEVLPVRPTKSSAAESKPSAFPILVCERAIPASAAKVSINAQVLPLPKPVINRIVVIGDTGCRIKSADKAAQPCNDSGQYPFASIASQAAKWKPDLVVHVGDYLYRENPCPAGNAGCAGSPWGYGWDAWNADFFAPAKDLLSAAPWIAVRGNHESCARAGQGWWRLIDPRPLQSGRDCNAAKDDDIGDYSDPYAVPIGGGVQFIVLDTSNTPGGVIPAGDIRERKYLDMYRKLDGLSRQAVYNIGVNHHPILGVAAKEKTAGRPTMEPGNRGLQSVFSQLNPLILPEGVDVMLSGHVHVWEQISFSTPHPTQFVAGFSGTSEDLVPLPETFPANFEPAPGAMVEHFSSWVNGFGYMTMERVGAQQWEVKIWNTSGQQVNACHIDGKKSTCDIAQVDKR